MNTEYLKKILNSRVYEAAVETRLQHAKNLSNRFNNKIWLKREDEQPVFSFKIRGAYNKISQLPDEVLQRGVVCASAGNHAQGVAYSANMLNINAIIIMPVITPQIKITGVEALGGKVILEGDSFDEAKVYALEYSKKHNMEFIPPFDDPDVIAGQGTIGVEILNQHSKPLEAIFIPVGGGGLISGIATYIKSIRPGIKIIGVEPDDAPTLKTALAHGKPTPLDRVGLFCDGVAVKIIGEEPFRLVKDIIDDVILVSTDETCAAIKDIFEDTRTLVEPSGAIAVAGMKKYINQHKCKDLSFVAINSGANINFDRMRHVAERAEIGEKREAIFSTQLPEKPGSFRKLCGLISNQAVTEFNYRYSDSETAHVFIGVSVSSPNQIESLLTKLNANDYKVENLSDNEMAKLHIRHMVGGHAPMAKNERIFRFIFPEKPGALLRFLDHVGEKWNISLFHYRNHGTDYGRVLVGMQVKDDNYDELQQYLDNIGYEYQDETDNPAIKTFLG